jgi:hypothetical protein
MSNATIPDWIPSGFQVASGNLHCPSPNSVLAHFGIYNIVSIATYLLLGSAVVKSKLACSNKSGLKPWRFWSSLGSVILQVIGTVSTSVLIRSSGYKVDIWQLVQIWALRPRVAFFIGNMVNVNRSLGYMNGALDNVVVEIFSCSLSCVFLGRLVRQALTWKGTRDPNTVVSSWYTVTCVAGVVMLLSTAFEIVWALWFLKRLVETKGRAEAQDVDSMKWIVRVMVPLTCVCSWLIWASFLKAAPGAYCPGNIMYINILWILVPVLTNVMRAIVEVF